MLQLYNSIISETIVCCRELNKNVAGLWYYERISDKSQSIIRQIGISKEIDAK